MVTSAIAMAATTAIVRRHEGGSITITKTWASSPLHRIGYVKRRGSSKAKLMAMDFEAANELFLLDYKAIVEMEEIISYDHTICST